MRKQEQMLEARRKGSKSRKLLDDVREAVRHRHMSNRTEDPVPMSISGHGNGDDAEEGGYRVVFG